MSCGEAFCAGCGWVGCARDLQAEVSSLRAAIEEHRRDVSGAAGEILNTDYADKRLWAVLDDA